MSPYRKFSKGEEDELCRHMKESGQIPDLEDRKHRTPKPLRQKVSRWWNRLLCSTLGHKWGYIYFIGGEECLRCFVYRTDEDLFKLSMRKGFWRRVKEWIRRRR